MTVFRIAAIFLFLFVWLPASAHATDRIKQMGPMKGLKKLAIEVIAAPGDDARQCGFDRSGLTGAAGAPMREVGIKPDVRGVSVFRVRLTMNYEDGRCTAYVASELLITMPLYFPHMGPANEAYLPTSTARLWSAGELVIRPVEAFAPYVMDLVARHSAAFSVQWAKDNNAS